MRIINPYQSQNFNYINSVSDDFLSIDDQILR